MTDLTTALASLVGKAFQDSPELAAIRQRHKSGEITEEIALHEMVDVLSRDPDICGIIEANRPNPESKVRLPRINPMVEAHIIERLQFDGDLPDLRTGPTPFNVVPAVPVALTARNPVVGGMMLKQASEEMQTKVVAHETRRLQLIEATLQKALPEMARVSDVLAKASETDVLALVWGNPDTDLPEYKRGQFPAPQKVETPSGTTLAKLTPTESQTAAWQLLSTTQGRMSAQPVIETIILSSLQKQGLKVKSQSTPAREGKTPLSSHEWTLNLSGKGSTQPAFNFIDMAGRVLAAGLKAKLPGTGRTTQMELEVKTINKLDDRIVGWTASLFEALPDGCTP